MYSKYDDINALLVRSNKVLSVIKKLYEEALDNKTIPIELLLEIKDYLGNLRSALDYLANKLKLTKFPVTNSAKDFTNAVSNIDQKAKVILEKWQPYNNNDWLKNFNLLNNKNKHVGLVPQKRLETRETRVTNSGGMVAWGSGVVFGGGVQVMGVPIDPATQLPVANNTVKTEIITWVSFIFDNKVSPGLDDNINALEFIDYVFTKICEVIADVETVI